MISKLVISKHPVKCSNILQAGVLMKRKKGGAGGGGGGGGAGTHFKSEPENQLMLVNKVLANLHRRIDSGRSYSVSSPHTRSCVH